MGLAQPSTCVDHDELNMLCLKGKIAQTLLETSENFQDPDALLVANRRSTAVECTNCCAAGKLLLAPCTPRIFAETNADRVGSGCHASQLQG